MSSHRQFQATCAAAKAYADAMGEPVPKHFVLEPGTTKTCFASEGEAIATLANPQPALDILTKMLEGTLVLGMSLVEAAEHVKHMDSGEHMGARNPIGFTSKLN